MMAWWKHIAKVNPNGYLKVHYDNSHPMSFDHTDETSLFFKKMLWFKLWVFAIKMKVQKEEWIGRVFQDSNTMLSQVWESESQHSLVVFPLWKFESCWVLNFWDENVSSELSAIEPLIYYWKGF